MATYRVRLFGDLEIVRQGDGPSQLPGRSAGSLLALLLVNRGHPVGRDAVASTLWADRPSSEGRKAVRTTLWRLGQALGGAPGGDPFTADREHIRISDPSEWQVDLWPFEDRLDPYVREAREIEGESEARRVAEALDLHRRPFLEGFHDRWCEDRRHRARLMWLTGLETLVRYRRRSGQWESVILEADLVLRVDPLRETMHRELIHAHYARGDRASALRLFERFRALICEELGVSPMPSTRRLHDGILKGEPIEELSALLDS